MNNYFEDDFEVQPKFKMVKTLKLEDQKTINQSKKSSDVKEVYNETYSYTNSKDGEG